MNAGVGLAFMWLAASFLMIGGAFYFLSVAAWNVWHDTRSIEPLFFGALSIAASRVFALAAAEAVEASK